MNRGHEGADMEQGEGGVGLLGGVSVKAMSLPRAVGWVA
jgi:hypothetical protein